MPEIKLKRCPFCGGEAKLLNSAGCFVNIVCESCRAKTGDIQIDASYCANEEVAKAWNKREGVDDA